jgi:hypothetical protein
VMVPPSPWLRAKVVAAIVAIPLQFEKPLPL